MKLSILLKWGTVILMTIAFNIDGNPRLAPVGSHPDMGAYENPLGLKVHRSERIYVSPGTALQIPHARHTATRLSDDRNLLVGGQQGLDESLAEVERFDPATGVMTPVAPLHTPRHDHSATLLPDGRVLVVGGYTLPQQWLGDAEVYDPAADTWTVVPPLYAHGTAHTATLLQDGRVLVVGGCIGSGVCTDRVEIFNPHTNAWTEGMPLESDRATHTAVLLDDGRVLVGSVKPARVGECAGASAVLWPPWDWTRSGVLGSNAPRQLSGAGDGNHDRLEYGLSE
jgi:hypothetical protein